MTLQGHEQLKGSKTRLLSAPVWGTIRGAWPEKGSTERRVLALGGGGTVIDQTPQSTPRETHSNLICLPGVKLADVLNSGDRPAH